MKKLLLSFKEKINEIFPNVGYKLIHTNLVYVIRIYLKCNYEEWMEAKTNLFSYFIYNKLSGHVLY